MSLTGRALILLSAVLTVLVAAVTVHCWRMGGRWRLPARVAGLLAVEILVMLTAGLVVNRNERFYPSWEALAGPGTGKSAARVAPPPVGRLDRTLRPGTMVAWSPPEEAGWRLAAPPTLVVPTGYARDDRHSFPVVVTLTSADQVAAARTRAAAAADVLTVVAVPTPATTAADLAGLPARLAQDARAAATGWAIVADPAHTALARAWRDLVPARFRAVTGSFETAVDRLPAALTPPVRLPS